MKMGRGLRVLLVVTHSSSSVSVSLPSLLIISLDQPSSTYINKTLHTSLPHPQSSGCFYVIRNAFQMSYSLMYCIITFELEPFRYFQHLVKKEKRCKRKKCVSHKLWKVERRKSYFVIIESLHFSLPIPVHFSLSLRRMSEVIGSDRLSLRWGRRGELGVLFGRGWWVMVIYRSKWHVPPQGNAPFTWCAHTNPSSQSAIIRHI